MNNLATLCVLAIFALLAGCTTEIRYVEVPVLPEDSWLVDCPIEQPPEKEKYRKASEDQKLVMMTDAYNAQTANNHGCTKRFAHQRTWKREQLELRKPKEKE